ncbi:MAG TPA: LptF/LptG family permease [Ignavibacteriaceae bacterium]|nr:LptF/LptG family permease [Ignavibacteriaceae bacterium]
MILSFYILRNHLIPFVFSSAALIGIFILQFLMKFADRLVGKGLDTWVIIKLILFNLAWMVVLVIPMATLVATLMAFGAMSQNNEITVMKSSGTSLYKMMAAPLIASVILGYLLFLFNNDVLPDANHQAKVLMGDISKQRPTLSLEPGVFSQEVSNYAILVRRIEKNSNNLYDITIYDYTNPGKINVVTAEKGRIYFAPDQSKLIMDLENGEIHESQVAQTNLYRKLVFKRHRIAMPAEQFTFQQSAPGGERGERELSIQAMQSIVDSLNQIKLNQKTFLQNESKKYLLADRVNPYSRNPSLPSKKKDILYIRAIEKVNTARNVILANLRSVDQRQEQINSYAVEIHKKYALPVACIVFILIGAPLGVMVKRGGFGVAASISLFFFLLYWAFLIGGEKLSERNFFSPFWGMWSANILLGAAGLFLTYRSVQETIIIRLELLKKLIPKRWRSVEDTGEELTGQQS